jgi:hypothetical protein
MKFCITSSLLPPSDLTKYIFRQKTLELLFESRKSQFDYSFRERVNTFLKQLKQYMSQNQLLDDPFYMGLHDDLIIILNTNQTIYNEMFSIARANSNGKCLSYNVTEIPTTEIPSWNHVGLKRSVAHPFFPDTLEYDDDVNIPMKPFSQNVWQLPTVQEEWTNQLLNTAPLNRAYSTPRQVEVMRSCSQPMDDEV